MGMRLLIMLKRGGLYMQGKPRDNRYQFCLEQ